MSSDDDDHDFCEFNGAPAALLGPALSSAAAAVAVDRDGDGSNAGGGPAGGDVHSMLLRGAPRRIFPLALAFASASSQFAPAVAVSKIFTSVGPYLLHNKPVGPRAFAFFAKNLPTFRFITNFRFAGFAPTLQTLRTLRDRVDVCQSITSDDWGTLTTTMVDILVGMPHLSHISQRGSKQMRFEQGKEGELLSRMLTHPRESFRASIAYISFAYTLPLRNRAPAALLDVFETVVLPELEKFTSRAATTAAFLRFAQRVVDGASLHTVQRAQERCIALAYRAAELAALHVQGDDVHLDVYCNAVNLITSVVSVALHCDIDLDDAPIWALLGATFGAENTPLLEQLLVPLPRFIRTEFPSIRRRNVVLSKRKYNTTAAGRRRIFYCGIHVIQLVTTRPQSALFQNMLLPTAIATGAIDALAILAEPWCRRVKSTHQSFCCVSLETKGLSGKRRGPKAIRAVLNELLSLEPVRVLCETRVLQHLIGEMHKLEQRVAANLTVFNHQHGGNLSFATMKNLGNDVSIIFARADFLDVCFEKPFACLQHHFFRFSECAVFSDFAYSATELPLHDADDFSQSGDTLLAFDDAARREFIAIRDAVFGDGRLLRILRTAFRAMEPLRLVLVHSYEQETKSRRLSRLASRCHAVVESLHKIAALEQHAHAATAATPTTAQQGSQKRRQRGEGDVEEQNDDSDDNRHPFLVSNFLGVDLRGFLCATLEHVEARLQKAVAADELPNLESDDDEYFGSDDVDDDEDHDED